MVQGRRTSRFSTNHHQLSKDEYIVQKITKKRKRSGTTTFEYFVKWEGFSRGSWEPEENISDDLLESFGFSPTSKRKKEERKYTIERILNLRTVKGQREFLIEWEGYPDRTWEPESEIPKESITEFLDALDDGKPLHGFNKTPVVGEIVQIRNEPPYPPLYLLSWENSNETTWIPGCLLPSNIIDQFKNQDLENS